MEISIIDYIIIVCYFILLFIIGFFVKKKVHNLNDYFLAGRRLTLPIFVATLVSTWYGGLLGVGELSFNYGLVNWLTQGFFWYLVYLFFAFFLANRIRKSKLYTIPDQLERFYDKKSRFLGSIFNFIMVTPAAYILSLGLIFNILFGWELWISIFVVSIVMIFYTIRGGFIGIIYTDFIQFILMMAGVAMIIPIAVQKYGGFDFLVTNLPETHLTLTGGWSTQLILVWGLLAFWTLADPGFYQRCYASKDDKIPKKGILIAIGFWFLFDICTTFTGMYAAAANNAGLLSAEATTSYLSIAGSLLPPVFLGLFLTGLIATVMSTVDSFTFLGAMNISHDLYKNIFKPNATDKQVMNATKIGIFITAGFAIILALFFKSIVTMWYTIGTIGISALIVPILFGFFYKGKKSPIAAVSSMIFGSGTSLSWMIYGYLNLDQWGWPQYIAGIEPLYPGLLVSLLVFIVVNIIHVRGMK
ncbi:MAG: sodium:solute symporter family protein [Candidatus Thermoplasmatota archaeon]|nr:sodium:solute symporter family protein [Candidatus Thermoplasmatota archaeon]